MKNLLSEMPEWAKNLVDAVAIPTGVATTVSTVLGMVSLGVGIVVGVLTAWYTWERIRDLRENRARRAASKS